MRSQRTAARRCFIQKDRLQDDEIIVKRNETAAERERDEPEQSVSRSRRAKGGAEQVKLSEETCEWREPGEREHEDRHATCEERGASAEASEISEINATRLPPDESDHAECTDQGEGINRGVEKRRRKAVGHER